MATDLAIDKHNNYNNNHNKNNNSVWSKITLACNLSHCSLCIENNMRTTTKTANLYTYVQTTNRKYIYAQTYICVCVCATKSAKELLSAGGASYHIINSQAKFMNRSERGVARQQGCDLYSRVDCLRYWRRSRSSQFQLNSIFTKYNFISVKKI